MLQSPRQKISGKRSPRDTAEQQPQMKLAAVKGKKKTIQNDFGGFGFGRGRSPQKKKQSSTQEQIKPTLLPVITIKSAKIHLYFAMRQIVKERCLVIVMNTK